MLNFEHNGNSIKFDFTGNKERELAPLCKAIVKAHSVPSTRIYVYVASTDDSEFANPNSLAFQGNYFRGFHVSPEQMHQLPQYLRQCVFRPDDELMYEERVLSFYEMLAVDHLVYIRNITCLNPVAFGLTLAHELQHVIQYCLCRSILFANSLLFRNLAATIDPATTLSVIDIPHERDANIISRRVAEEVFGAEPVNAYIDSQIAMFRDMSRFGHSDAVGELKRWEFLRDCNASATYDLKTETIRMIDQYKSRIPAELAKSFRLDFSLEEWWETDSALSLSES